jgi:hypothetical protein
LACSTHPIQQNARADYRQIQPNKAQQRTPSRHAPLFHDRLSFLSTSTLEFVRPFGVTELDVRHNQLIKCLYQTIFSVFTQEKQKNIPGFETRAAAQLFYLKVCKDDLIEPDGDFHTPFVTFVLWPNKALQLTPRS